MKHKLLDQKARNAATRYKKCEQELVAIIAQIDSSKAFYKIGYSSLFSYMTQALGLSEAMACNISAVVRKAYLVPKLQEKVLSGEISLSKARKLTPVITLQNQDRWLELAKSKNQRQIEREVSLANPKVAIAERAKYIPADSKFKERVEIKRSIPRLKLELGLSEKLMLQLRRCQDLESQKQRKNIDLENCLEALVQLYLNKQDPLRKAQRQKAKGKLTITAAEQMTATASVSDRPISTTTYNQAQKKVKAQTQKTKRLPIPANKKHQVHLRDSGRCSYRNLNGKRCSSHRYLEIHHKTPVYAGGGNQLENLQLLCSGHHKVTHQGDALKNQQKGENA